VVADSKISLAVQALFPAELATPSTLHPPPYTLTPIPCSTLNRKLEAQNTNPKTRNLKT